MHQSNDRSMFCLILPNRASEALELVGHDLYRQGRVINRTDCGVLP
jgi:hypothetical protein